MTFDLSELESFGGIAAEDEPVLDYFLSTKSVEEIERGNKLLVLGRKGSGKMALVRHFTESGQIDHGKPLSLRSYPWNNHKQLIDHGASDTEAYVASWRLLIAIRMASLVCAIGSSTYTDALAALSKFLQKNFGTTDPESRTILTRGKLEVSGLSIGPTISGVSLGAINFGAATRTKVLGLELDSLTNSILNDVTTAISELQIERLFLHFDELDQGLDKLDDIKSRMLVGLILAAREISSSAKYGANVCPIVYLRTDIWDQLSFSDKNKISQNGTIHLKWDEKSLLELVEARLRAKLGKPAFWHQIEDGSKMRGSQSKWNHILARTLFRPRDVIQFLNEALATAKRRAGVPLILENVDINEAREPYFYYLKNEVDDEVMPHWPYWSQALQACSRTETITFAEKDFEKNYQAIKTKDNTLDAASALEFLYRFSVVGYEKRLSRGGSSCSFKYIDNHAGWNPSAPRFKVHPGLKEFAKLKEERG